MNTLTLNSKAKDVLIFTRQIEAVTGEQATRSTYLWYLASVHPKPCTFDEVETELNLTKSQVSRVTRDLHKVNSAGNEGLDLIDITFDLHNPRYKLVSLNAKGMAAVKEMLEYWG